MCVEFVCFLGPIGNGQWVWRVLPLEWEKKDGKKRKDDGKSDNRSQLKSSPMADTVSQFACDCFNIFSS